MARAQAQVERRRLRVAMVSPPYIPVPPRGYGGTELVIAELIDGLIEQGAQLTLFAPRGSVGGHSHRCDVVSPLGEPVWPSCDSVERQHCLLAFRQISAGGAFDIVHAHSPSAVAFAESVKIPTVQTIHHDRNPIYSLDYALHPEVYYALISSRQRALEVPLSRSAVAPHGLSPERYPLGAGVGGFAAFLGRFSACKGLHHAIDAAARAGIPLRAAGKPHPPDAGYADRELWRRLKMSHVQCVGEADHAQKLALLQNALALLFPIEWEEPFGLVLVESMLCGTPVIAFPRGSVPEIVEPGRTGFWVSSVGEMASALRHLARHPFDRAACRARAIERFGRDAMVSRYLALYARALGIRADTGASLAPHG